MPNYRRTPSFPPSTGCKKVCLCEESNINSDTCPPKTKKRKCKKQTCGAGLEPVFYKKKDGKKNDNGSRAQHLSRRSRCRCTTFSLPDPPVLSLLPCGYPQAARRSAFASRTHVGPKSQERSSHPSLIANNKNHNPVAFKQITPLIFIIKMMLASSAFRAGQSGLRTRTGCSKKHFSDGSYAEAALPS